MMAVANVTVAYVNQPKEGSKKGSIKTDTGELYGVWQEKLGLFSKGGQYTIEYDTEMYNGKQYKTVKRVVKSESSPGGSGGAKASGDTKAVEMAVMGIVRGAYEGTGGLPDEDTLYSHMLAVRAAWIRAFATPLGPVKTQERPLSEELNDEIPF